MLSIAHNFLFIHVPKTAGNSIQSTLLPYSEDSIALLAPHHDGIDRFEIRSPHLTIHKHSTLADYRRQLAPGRFDRLFKFSSVRNPWDRCVSFFFSPHRGPVEWSRDTFADFIEDKVRPSHTYLTLDGDETDPFGNVDATIRYEHLESDFAGICRRIGITAGRLPVLNASVRGDYRQYYRDDRMIESVARKFAPVIGRFNYTFDP